MKISVKRVSNEHERLSMEGNYGMVSSQDTELFDVRGYGEILIF